MAEKMSAAIGATPLIRLEKLSSELGANVFVKYEAANPGGSIKDRAAKNMIDAAEARGEIAPGKSGIGIAMIGAARGYEVVLTMPESMSKERRMLLAAYGAKLVLTPAADGMAGAVAEAERIERETPGAWIVGQFTNPDNPAAHEKTTLHLHLKRSLALKSGRRSAACVPITWWRLPARAARCRAWRIISTVTASSAPTAWRR